MSQTAQFSTLGFKLLSVEQINDSTLKVHFTNDVLAQNPVNANDGLNPANYSITGPTPNFVTSVDPIDTDLAALILNLKNPLSTGNWTLTALNIVDIDGHSIVAGSLVFGATYNVQEQSISEGASTHSSSDIINEHITPMFRGKAAWSALINGISTGDEYLADLAQKTYNQLFLTTASGEYVTQRAADRGYTKPKNLGLNDATLGKLAAKISSQKVTLQSFLEILEIFYGEDAIRATIDSENVEPFALSDGDDLLISIDGKTVSIVFNEDDFQVITKASAIEVATVITNGFTSFGINAYAKPIKDPLTSKVFIRIYSGALGLRGSVSVNGGRAQNSLKFSTNIETLQDSTTQFTVDTYSTNNAVSADGLRFTFTSGTDPKLRLVQSGDYANIYGAGFNAENRGTFKIIASGTTFFEVVNPLGSNQVVTLSAATDIQFFRPNIFTVNSKSRHTAVMQAENDNVCDIILPATTEIVSRTPDTATYLNSTPSLKVTPALIASSVVRSANVVTVTTQTPHNLQVGNTFLFGPGDSNFKSGIKTVVAIVDTDTFTYSETGTDATLGASGGTSSATVNPTIIYNTANLGNLETQYGYNGNSSTIIPSSYSKFGNTNVAHVMAAGDGWNENPHFLVFNSDLSVEQVSMPEDSTAFPSGIYAGQGCPLDSGNAFYCGGMNPGGGGAANTHAYSYNWTAKTWTRLADMPDKRAGSLAVLQNGKVYLFGGVFGGTAIMAPTGFQSYDSSDCNEVWIYDIAGDSWTVSATAYPESSALDSNGAVVALDNGKILIVDPYATHSGYLFNPTDESFTAVSADPVNGGTYDAGWYMSNASNFSTAALLLASGKVFVGGSDTTNAQASLYDPTTNTWSYLGVGPATTSPMAWAVEAGADIVYLHCNDETDISNNGSGSFINVSTKAWTSADTETATTDAGSTIDGFYLGGQVIGVNLATDSELNMSKFAMTITESGGTISDVASYICPNYAANNNVTLTTTANHNLSSGQIIVDNLTSLGGVINDRGIAEVGTMGTSEQKAYAAVALLQDGRVLIAGGGTTSPGNTNVYTFNPADNTFTLQGTLSYQLYQGSATTLDDGKVLIVNGNVSDAPIAQIFDPNTNSIVGTGTPLSTRKNHTATKLKNGKVLITGGTDFSDTVLKSVEIYDPATFTFSSGPDMAVDRSAHSAILLNDGTVLVYGDSNTAEIYNPNNNTWHSTSNFIDGRLGSTLTLLDNGNVLVVGNGSLSEIYDNRTETSVQGPALPGSVSGHAAIKLSSGNVLIIGGGTNKLYLYNKLTNSFTTLPDTLPQSESSMSVMPLGNDKFFITCGDGTVNSVYNYNGSTQTCSDFSGIRTLASVTSNTITYKSDNATTAPLTTINADIGSVQPFKADDAVVKTGYVFDPGSNGLSLTSIQTTLSQDVNENETYSVLNVGDTAGFDSNGGFLAIDFGRKTQTGPVKYIGIVSNTQLAIDSKTIFDYNLSSGAIVIKLSQSTATDPSIIGCPVFYLTDSVSGYLAASNAIDDISAVGIEINKKTIYPGTKGLGGGNIDTSSTGPKLNDAIYVWGSEDQVQTKRGF